MTRRNTGPSAEVRALILARSGGVCEVTGSPGGPFQIHHRRPRGAGGTRRPETNGPANLLHVSEKTHAEIESQRAEAKARGLLVSQHHDPAQLPVLLRFGWTYLTAAGGYSDLAPQDVA